MIKKLMIWGLALTLMTPVVMAVSNEPVAAKGWKDNIEIQADKKKDDGGTPRPTPPPGPPK